MSDERRSDPRIPLRAQAEVKFSSWAMFSLIYSVNISRGGMTLELPQAPAVGMPLSIKLTLPGERAIELDAVVRHVSPGRAGFAVGVQFQSLDAARRAQIEEAIKSHKP